ncbi:MAG: NAD-dependent epimerase/dehydratase family protein [Deltaproteobacteria bacterium]|nr:NAD-dependent epimerase/dehydratase family protein [Deltaproteobacteria bacterium]MBI2366909.1 NAD-dependent epimerase/dehydratase family protein [Deltaproteobacteria bacterium]MBI2531860.1 NAD-dependent epimerase/dehydratase family protein [Deltaproteobacteria bacterium]
MRAIVTGGAGFIGSHMVDLLLERGIEVRVLDNLVAGRLHNLSHHSNDPRCVFEQVDVCNLADNAPIFRDVEYVFHFAGIGDIVPSIERPRDYLKINVQGTVAVMEASRTAGVKKVIYAASSSCYGLAKELPTTEVAPIQPQYPYALSKYLGECVALHWNQVYRLPVNCIRIFNAYGPRSRTTGAYGAVFGVFLAQKLKAKPFTVVGDGTQTRDFVYATDVARAFLAAAESEVSGEIFNLGSGSPQSVNRLVELLGGPVVHVPKRPGEPDCTWADTRKIRSRLGWSPGVSFEDGVAVMMQRIAAWADAPVWTSESIAVATQKWFEHLDR